MKSNGVSKDENIGNTLKSGDRFRRGCIPSVSAHSPGEELALQTNWQFKIPYVGPAASVILAAMRTGFQFYVSSRLTAVRFLGGTTGIIDGYSILEAAVTMIGIEGLMVAFGLITGYKNAKTQVNARWIVVLDQCALFQGFHAMNVLAGLIR